MCVALEIFNVPKSENLQVDIIQYLGQPSRVPTYCERPFDTFRLRPQPNDVFLPVILPVHLDLIIIRILCLGQMWQ